MNKMFGRILCVLSVMALAALAQFPGIPGQTNPNGRRPQGGSQQPPQTRTPRSDSKAKNNSSVITTAGILRRVSPNQLVIEADDHRVIWYRISAQVPVRKDGKDADLSTFARGDYLSVNSTEDDLGILTAVSVSWKKEATAADREEAANAFDLPRLPAGGAASTTSASSPARDPGDERPVLRRNNPEPEAEAKEEAKPEAAPKPKPEPVAVATAVEEPEDTRPATTIRPPDPKPDADDPGPPSLRRGKPAPRSPAPADSTVASSAPPSPPVPAPVASNKPATPAATQVALPPQAPAPKPAAVASAPILPPAEQPEDSTIAKAREASAEYAATLPNFLVQQMTTRYQSDQVAKKETDWKPLDIVSADVTYQNGQESYKNIKVGNKAVNKSMDEIGGSHSTGEFATIVEQLMDPGSGATFHRKSQDTIRNRAAVIYTYEIPRERAVWRVETPSQLYYPALRGSIWIDKETSRILRIEQQGRALPPLFPLDTVETSADYDFVRLDTSRLFLLPVEAETLSCIRGTSVCSRNKIEFRNYRKFGSDSNITFDQK